MTAEWSTRFDNVPFTQFAFATGDASSFIIIHKDVVYGGYYDNVPQNFIRSSLNPDAEGISPGGQFNRDGVIKDPTISATVHT